MKLQLSGEIEDFEMLLNCVLQTSRSAAASATLEAAAAAEQQIRHSLIVTQRWQQFAQLFLLLEYFRRVIDRS